MKPVTSEESSNYQEAIVKGGIEFFQRKRVTTDDSETINTLILSIAMTIGEIVLAAASFRIATT